jgi:DNA-binding PadR family transcriptional regulator
MTTMSATRLLLLGVVRTHGQANGYLVNAELESWGAEKWAGLKPGSIYQSLRQLAKEGLLDAGEIHEWPERIDYKITEKGTAEFLRLLRSALSRPDHRPETLGAALALLPALPRKETIALLRERLRAMEAEHTEILDRAAERGGPSHIRELLGMRAWSTASGADWARGLIARLENGDHVMADEGDRPAGTALIPKS